MEETKMVEAKKGMSKGCIIGLVVAGVLLVIVVGGGFLCYANRTALVKMGMTTVVNSVKAELEENPVEGVDAQAYALLAERFVEKLDLEEELDQTKMESFGLQMQLLGQKMDDLSADDVNNFMSAMVEYYPELKEYLPAQDMTEGVGDTPVEEAATTE